MKIKALISIIIIGFILAFIYHFIAIAAIDAPHNPSYNISCGKCHGQGLLQSPFWGGSMSYDELCQYCHTASSCPIAEITGPLVKTHSDSNEISLAECRTCHDPHYQKQKNYKNTDADNLFLASGTITGYVNNGDGTSTLTYSSIEYKTETGWDATRLTGKTWECRSTILFPNKKKLSFNYPIIGVDEVANTITVKGDVSPAYQYISPPTDFIVLYGQFIRDNINGKPVKFFDQEGVNSFADGDTTYNGVCEICHTQTAYFRNDGSGSEHPDYEEVGGAEGTNCISCHTHNASFGHCFSGGGGAAGCHGETGSHAVHDVETIGCNPCHTDPDPEDEITGYPPHVSPGGGYSFTYDDDNNTCFNVRSDALGSCHFETEAQWGESACAGCHSSTHDVGNRVNVIAQFNGNSHHIQGTALEGTHCYQCHWEADETGLITSYHESDVSGSPVNLVLYGAGVRPTTYTEGTTAIQYIAEGTRFEIKKLNTHCLSCHSDQNNDTVPFGDGKTPKEYAWDNTSIDARYSQTGTTAWVRYGGDADVPIINESFEEIKDAENDGYDEFIKGKKSSGSTLDPDYTPIPSPVPPGAGSQCLKSAILVDQGKQAYAIRDFGLEIAKTITSFYLNVETAQEFTGGSGKKIALLENRKGTNVIVFRLNDNAGELQFNLKIFNDGDWRDYYYPDTGSISLNTWYKIDIAYDNINDAWEWKVNGETQPDTIYNNTLTGTHRKGIQIWKIGFLGTGVSLTGTIYFDLISVEGHNNGNFTPKNTQTKAYSSHGNATANQGGWDLNETWPNTREGSEDIACFDCHNSHGSHVEGTTTSYTSATTNGGILKDTESGKGGYTIGYKPQAGGSSEDKNAYNAGAGLCFDCHMNANSGTTPWGYQSTFGATQAIMGYRDTPYFGTDTSNPQQRFPYKALTLSGVPRVRGGHFGASSTLSSTPTETIGGLCTPCHDPHGISTTLEQEYAIPLLKGTWLTSFYKEDRAPANNIAGTIRTDKGKEGIQYYIDQNTLGPDIGGEGIHIKETDTQFAGLCLKCHPKESLTDGADGGTWKSIDRIHESVKGWGANVKHNYPCSKCHAPHNARLPRLMVTNCLDRRLKGRMENNTNPVLLGEGSGCSCCDNFLYLCEDTRCAEGFYPYDGCSPTSGNIVCYDKSQELGYCPDTPKTHVISLKGQGSGNFPGKWFGGWADSPSYYGNYNKVTCHKNHAADQSWNNVTQWYNDRPVILYPPGTTADEPTAVGADIQVTITWTTDIASTSYVDYGITEAYGSTAGDTTLVTDHSVTLTGLTNYSFHHYKVRSAGPLGTEVESIDNILDYIELPPLAPSLHDEPNALCVETCPVTLEWDEAINPGNGGPVDYRVQVKKEATGWANSEHDSGWITETDASCDGSTCNWTVTIRPDPDTIWNWRVRARDTDPPRLTSDWSSVDSFTVTQPPGSPPLDPIIIDEPDVVSPASADITLQWEHVAYSDPLDYFVQVNSESDFSGTGANNHISDWIAEGTLCVGSTCSWTLTLSTDTSWYWRVQARNQNNNGLISPWSSVDSFTIYPLIINESFETNPGYDETWTEGGYLDNLDPDYLHSSIPGTPTPPTGAGSECLQSVSSTSGYNAYATRDLGSVQPKTFTRFYVYIEAEGLATSSDKDIITLEDNGGNNVIIFRLRKGSGGNLKFRLRLYNNGGWTNYISTAISLNTWYKIDIKYDNVNNTWQWRLDGVSQDSGSLSGSHYAGIQKWNFGMQNQSITGTIYFDLVTVNTLTFY